MNRTEKILYHIDKNSLGLEIGPSHNPIAPKKSGYNVHIIDHLDQAGLKQKYSSQNAVINSIDNIEEVDFVWNGQSYSELTGRKNCYDWIIASHVIEHIPDLIAFFNDCDEILKEDGLISLAVPDKRFCFDHFRQVSSIASVIDAHYGERKIHTPGTAADFFLNVTKKDEHITWTSHTVQGDYRLFHGLEPAKNAMEAIWEKGEYFDLHAWCFTPHSFRLIIHDLYSLGLISFQELSFFPTEGCEFYITLGKQGKGIGMNRLDVLKIIESELVP